MSETSQHRQSMYSINKEDDEEGEKSNNDVEAVNTGSSNTQTSNRSKDNQKITHETIPELVEGEDDLSDEESVFNRVLDKKSPVNQHRVPSSGDQSSFEQPNDMSKSQIHTASRGDSMSDEINTSQVMLTSRSMKDEENGLLNKNMSDELPSDRFSAM